MHELEGSYKTFHVNREEAWIISFRAEADELEGTCGISDLVPFVWNPKTWEM